MFGFEHEKINFISPRVRYFPKISDHFPKISEDFENVVRRSYECFRTFSEVFRRLPKIAEDCRRLPRKIRRFFDLISINLGPLSIITWQTLQANWSKMISHCVDIIFIHTCVIPFFSICYHSLYHCSLYNK